MLIEPNASKRADTRQGVWLYMSDMDLGGSGYMHIGTNLVNRLILDHHIGVVVLGFMYDGRPHDWPFSIQPIRSWQQMKRTIELIEHSGVKIAGIIQAMDIPLQAMMYHEIQSPIPRISIFPVESAPLSMEWASNMAMASERLVMSQTAKQALAAYGITSRVLPIGVHDPHAWRPIEETERQVARQALGYDTDTFGILTIADNQERKNLNGAYQAVSKFAVEIKTREEGTGFAGDYEVVRPVRWHLVTRVESQAGWQLDDLAYRYGLNEVVTLHQRGMPQEDLRMLMAAANCVLLSSKAEGLAVPVLEAFAAGVPVVATNFAAIAEHLGDGERGYPINYEYSHMDVWGNGERVFIDPDHAAAQLLDLYTNGPKDGMLEAARAYVEARNWKRCGQMLADVIREVSY